MVNKHLDKFKVGYKKLGLKFHSFLNDNLLAIVMAIVTGISIVIRYMVALHPTNDMVGYILNGWMKSIESAGFKNFYTIDADYSPLYLFMIAIFTKLPKGNQVTINGYTFYQNWMYYIKSVYFLMDILIAVGVFLVVKEVTKDKTKAAIGYIISLCLPVQFANSALWGNNDSMYFCCFIYILYFILKRKDHLVWFFFGLSFSLKLQSVFVLPFLFYLVFSRRLKFYPIYMALVALMLSFLPSYCCGASFLKPFEFFTKEVNGYSQLTLGCGNLWKFFSSTNMDSSSDALNKASTWIGLLFIFLFTAIIYIRRIKLTKENIVFIGTFLIGIVPFFLPHMHERYFYSLDVLILVYCLVRKKRYFFVPLMQLSSGIAYYHYLSGFKTYIINTWGEDTVTIASVINLFLLTFIFIDLLSLDHYSKDEYKELLDKEKENLNPTLKDELTKDLLDK